MTELGPRTEKQVRLLTDSRNRAILSILDEADAPLHVEELADRLVSHDVSVVPASEYEAKREQTLLSLHHDQLPRLADSDLIEYDPTTNIASYLTPRSATVQWEDESIIDALVSYLPTTPEASEAGVGVLTGRKAAIEYGRQLADAADEELFCMYVSTELLSDECLRRAEDAIDRGVSMYMGSQNADVRELTRTRLPEATIWEPQLDWLNTPNYPRVGRLVLVDRRKVMLAILEDPESDGTAPEETALVGEGEENPLVVLVRELLGPRLDHLDFQSNEFRNELPT